MVSENISIQRAFRLAGFPNGRPSPTPPDDYVPTLGGSYEVIVNLFSDNILEVYESLAGSGDGAEFRLAALLLQHCLDAGFATDGRRLDVNAIQIADTAVNYASEQEHRADMSRRIRSLTSQAIRLEGGVTPSTGGTGGTGSTGGDINVSEITALAARLIAEHTAVSSAHHVKTPETGGTGGTGGERFVVVPPSRNGNAITRVSVFDDLSSPFNYQFGQPNFDHGIAWDDIRDKLVVLPPSVNLIVLWGGGPALANPLPFAGLQTAFLPAGNGRLKRGGTWTMTFINGNSRVSPDESVDYVANNVVRLWHDGISLIVDQPGRSGTTSTPVDVAALIAAHAAISEAHHAIPNVAAMIAAHAALPNIHHTPTTEGVNLPAYSQSTTEALFSRAGSLFWEIINEVPDTPGDASGIGHVLTVTGENDRDYAWRRPNAARVALATGGGLAYDRDGELHTSPSLVATAAEADANALAIAAETTARTDADTALGVRIDSEATDRAAADTALGARIDALPSPSIADPVVEPPHWVDTNDARTFTVHYDSAALPAAITHVAMEIGGQKITVAKVAEQHTYAFAFDATASGNISRNVRAGQTIRARITTIDDGVEVARWFETLYVIAAAPVAPSGGGFPTTRTRIYDWGIVFNSGQSEASVTGDLTTRVDGVTTNYTLNVGDVIELGIGIHTRTDKEGTPQKQIFLFTGAGKYRMPVGGSPFFGEVEVTFGSDNPASATTLCRKISADSPSTNVQFDINRLT